LYAQWADEEWVQQFGSCAEIATTSDYAYGFHEGFVDFCYAGGTGDPPPVPPRTYWNVAVRNAEGKERVQQWFEGYRHGARVAREGGYREMAVVQCFGTVGERYERSQVPYRGMNYLDGNDPGEMTPYMELLPEPSSETLDKRPETTGPRATTTDIVPPELTMPADETPAGDAATPSPEDTPALAPPATSRSMPKASQRKPTEVVNPFRTRQADNAPQRATTPN
jgi:hypothetical protein